MPKPKLVLTRPEWLVRASNHIENGDKWSCAHEGENFALVKIPGHTAWFRVGEKKFYPTEWVIFDKALSYSKQPNKEPMFTGWMNTSKMERAKAHIAKLDKEKT